MKDQRKVTMEETNGETPQYSTVQLQDAVEFLRNERLRLYGVRNYLLRIYNSTDDFADENPEIIGVDEIDDKLAEVEKALTELSKKYREILALLGQGL